MLRFFVLLLLFANGAYFAWKAGYVASVGLAPIQQSEPQRVQTQIKPEAIRLLNNTEAKRVDALASTPPARAPECLQATLLNAAQAGAVRAAAANLPAGAWSLEESNQPARWIVYMGKYANAEALAKKKSELRELSVAFESLKNPTLEPGMSLGVYATQSQASAAMATLVKRGVRTGKVVQELPARTTQLLKFPAVDDALLSQLNGIKAILGAASLVACKAG